MKFKEQRGSVFVFDGGDGEYNCQLIGAYEIEYKRIIVHRDLLVDLDCGYAEYTDIQTAVNLMQILIDEGIV